MYCRRNQNQSPYHHTKETFKGVIPPALLTARCLLAPIIKAFVFPPSVTGYQPVLWWTNYLRVWDPGSVHLCLPFDARDYFGLGWEICRFWIVVPFILCVYVCVCVLYARLLRCLFDYLFISQSILSVCKYGVFFRMFLWWCTRGYSFYGTACLTDRACLYKQPSASRETGLWESSVSQNRMIYFAYLEPLVPCIMCVGVNSCFSVWLTS